MLIEMNASLNFLSGILPILTSLLSSLALDVGGCLRLSKFRPGQGVVRYQYTRYFAPKTPIYLKIVKCVILNTKNYFETEY